jgi:exosortase/archaeosortase family protein
MSSKHYLNLPMKFKFLKFPIQFTATFLLLYGFNIAFIGFTTKGGHYYLAFLDYHFNYIDFWRSFTIRTTAEILGLLGFQVFESGTKLQVYEHGGFNLIYSCLGYGMMSLFSAFVICYPSRNMGKTSFMIKGLSLIQGMNMMRFIALALFWKNGTIGLIDHHLIYNCCVYLILLNYIYRRTHNRNDNLIGNGKHTTT